MLDYKLYGLNPTGFRLTNIMISILSGIISYKILLKLQFSNIIACLLSLLFLLHPLQIETITYISGRGDALYILLCLLTCLLFLSPSKTKLILASITMIIAIITKENSVSFPLILWIISYLYKQKNTLKTASILLIISSAYSLFRIIYPSTHKTLSWIEQASVYEQLATIPYIITKYIALVFFPYPLHMEYHTVISSLINIYSLSSLTLICLLLLPILFIKNKNLYSLGIGWFFICLLPVSQLAIPLSATLREHWASLALFGFIISYGVIMQTLYKTYPKIILNLLLIQIICLAGTTWQRNQIWKDPITLYNNDLKYEPRSFIMLNNLGYNYFMKKNYQKAKYYFKKSIYNSPKHSYDIALNNLGAIYENENNIPMAKHYYQKSIKTGKYNLATQNLKRISKQKN
tara:strand:+ start:12081 stop:13295 length:1215 start_codon:yes stop_codon:yes gene_type:complete